MLSGVTSLPSLMTPSTFEWNLTSAGKPHRGFQLRSSDRHRDRSRRRPRSYRGFRSPTYEVTSNKWDQQNRLVRELHGTHESVYDYDGESHRTRIKELTSSVETKNETFLWCGPRICQKRNSGGVVRNYFKEGFEEGTSDYFYTRDHLRSVREVVASDGSTVASRRTYDPWGKGTETASGALTDFGFTGHYFDRPTGLGLPQYRGYDPNLGRWLSRDPAGLDGGLNLYGYVENDPINGIDPSGLWKICIPINPFVWICFERPDPPKPPDQCKPKKDPTPEPKPEPQNDCAAVCEPFLGPGKCYWGNDGYQYCNDWTGQHAYQRCYSECTGKL